MKNLLSLCFIICCSSLLFSACKKELSDESGPGVGVAHGTLKDTSDNCLPDSVHGTYYNGITPGSDTCFVELQVNVTESGSYTISTDLQNGFQFFDSGFFNATGINIIRLKPIGTPIIPIATVFSVSFDSSVCSFFVDVKDSTGTGLGGQDTSGNGGGDTTQAPLGMWKLYDSDNAKEYSGSAAILDTIIGGVPQLIFTGTVVTLDTILTMQFFLGDTALTQFDGASSLFSTSGTSGSPSSFKFSYLSGSTLTHWYVADSSTVRVMTFAVTGNSVTRILTGKFSGTADDQVNGGSGYIKGSFTVAVP